MISAILLLLSFLCFVLATFNAPLRFNLTAAGLAFWVATHLLPALSRLAAVVLVAGTMLLAGCQTIPVTAKACYVTKSGQRVCVSGGTGGIVLEGDFKQSR